MKKKNESNYTLQWLFGASLVFVASGFLMNAFSVYHWLKYGEWPFTYFLVFTTILSEKFANWYFEPQTWVGVNKIVKWIFEKDFSFHLYLIGFALHGIQTLIEED